ncbi:MAG: alpha/beta hydrolase [Glaciihabitans sp.]|nr:alpha/beta hydrolase [Glaciihabitans sp.]
MTTELSRPGTDAGAPAPTRRGSKNRRRSLVAAIAAAASVVLVLSGCSTWFEPPVSASTPTSESVDGSLEPFYKQVLQWSSCGDKLECATATAPLSWSDLGGDTIDLALVRQLATSGTSKGSLLVNPGGPGGSGYDLIHDSVDFATSDRLQQNFDIVGFDPRGVNKSTPVSCYSDPATLDAYLFNIIPGERGSDQWIADTEAASAQFGKDCLANTGELLGNVDTVSAAKDLDMLRAALGDDTLNYLGYSYGTELGGTYAELFPKKTGRLVFDGAVDPTAASYDISLNQAKGFEGALRAFMASCSTLENCPFTGTPDESMQTVRALLDTLDASPLANADGRQLGAGSMFTAIILPLYSETTWSALANVFASVMQGDPSYAFTVADAYYDRTADGTYTGNSTEAFNAISCIDYSTDHSVETMRQQAAELDAAAPVFGHLMAWGGTSCYDWPFPAVREPAAVAASGSSDILVVGTTNDPATPYVWAQNVASQLENGHLVTFTGEGHTAYNKTSTCINDTVDNYFVDGTVPATDPMC